LEEELKTIVQQKSISQPCSFAVTEQTDLKALRKKKGGDSTTASHRAFKIPINSLNPVFVSWVYYGKLN
jgi:hypothetical protein